MTRLLTIGLMALFINLFAQTDTVVISGRLIDASIEKPVANAHIVINLKYIQISDSSGKFTFKIPAGNQFYVYISHLQYNSLRFNMYCCPKDTVIALTPRIIELKPFQVTSPDIPVKITSSVDFHVLDYIPLENRLVIMTGDARNKPSKLMVTDFEGNILVQKNISPEFQGLFTDYENRVFIYNKRKYFRVLYNSFGLFLLPVDQRSPSKEQLQNIVSADQFRIIFTNQQYRLPYFKLFYYRPQDSALKDFYKVIDPVLDWQYYYEYYKLTNAEKAYASRIAYHYKGYDKHDIAAIMTGFADDWMYEPLYAPVFKTYTDIVLFDHYTHQVCIFSQDTVLIKKTPIAYHHELKNWNRQIIHDPVFDQFYTSATKNGYVTIYGINIHNGRHYPVITLKHRYPENIKIYAGKVYYIYRPVESLQKKSLYFQNIPPVNFSKEETVDKN